MRINKIPKGGLRRIVREVISSAKELGIELDCINADWWDQSPEKIGSVIFETKNELVRVNYFNTEREVHFCDTKRGESKLVDTIYRRICMNQPSLSPTYRIH